MFCSVPVFSVDDVLLIGDELFAEDDDDDVLTLSEEDSLEDDDVSSEDEDDDVDYEEDNNSSCPCCYKQYPIYISALLRSLKIYAFIFVTNVAFSLLIEFVGTDNIQNILLTNSIFQPFVTALFGFIPNCVITVVLAQLYCLSSISFGSLLAGLITNAGLSFVCLFRYGASKKDLLKVFSILYLSACLFGLLFILI